MHPGSHVTSTAEEGLERIVEAARSGPRTDCRVQGADPARNHRRPGFQPRASLRSSRAHSNSAAHPKRFGVCVDTCHIFAAGYKISTRAEYKATMKEFDELVGLDRIRAFHLNDSVRELGSRVDRHAKIGAGKIGLEPFRYLLNDKRFAEVPMYMETPKGDEDGEALDAINLRTLRELVE